MQVFPRCFFRFITKHSINKTVSFKELVFITFLPLLVFYFQSIPEPSLPSQQVPSTEVKSPPLKPPQKLAQLHSLPPEKSSAFVDDNYTEELEQERLAMASKKKKDKSKKKKQKGPSTSELAAPLPPPRGMVPLSSLGPPGAPKLGALDPRGLKPAPWEHGPLGPLRQVPPEPAPPTSPRFGRKGYPYPGEGFDHNENLFERPRSPEPPRSPRDMGGHHLHPSPPDASFRGPIEGGVHERDMAHGSMSQVPLKSMVSEQVIALLAVFNNLALSFISGLEEGVITNYPLII